ncbi:hypothetical protein J6590_006409 [Homalodisca vitripennis]|nr:hypothetical protein J6590_006409 [Homalodisca vitripennis]
MTTPRQTHLHKHLGVHSRLQNCLRLYSQVLDERRYNDDAETNTLTQASCCPLKTPALLRLYSQVLDVIIVINERRYNDDCSRPRQIHRLSIVLSTQESRIVDDCTVKCWM